MALTFGFYDSLNHDRLYNAQQMSAIFDGIINDGVFASVGSHFSVVPGTGMHVLVKSGRAWFNSTWTLNDSDIDLTIDAADSLLGRIDTVVLEVNSEQATRANSIKVVKGTAASTPAKPTLTNTTTVHQHPLAHITVVKNTTAITASMIEIVVGKTDCPFVTAILQTTDITNLFEKWENDFQTWFSTVRSTLDGDVALNLQNQIDANWRNTLKDATKTKLGLASDAVPDDAFNALIEDVTGIGNIAFSTNLSMGEKWVINNGQTLYEDDYPSVYLHEDRFAYFAFDTPTELTVDNLSQEAPYTTWYKKQNGNWVKIAIDKGNDYYVCKIYEGSTPNSLTLVKSVTTNASRSYVPTFAMVENGLYISFFPGYDVDSDYYRPGLLLIDLEHNYNYYYHRYTDNRWPVSAAPSTDETLVRTIDDKIYLFTPSTSNSSGTVSFYEILVHIITRNSETISVKQGRIPIKLNGSTARIYQSEDEAWFFDYSSTFDSFIVVAYPSEYASCDIDVYYNVLSSIGSGRELSDTTAETAINGYRTRVTDDSSSSGWTNKILSGDFLSGTSHRIYEDSNAIYAFTRWSCVKVSNVSSTAAIVKFLYRAPFYRYSGSSTYSFLRTWPVLIDVLTDSKTSKKYMLSDQGIHEFTEISDNGIHDAKLLKQGSGILDSVDSSCLWYVNSSANIYYLPRAYQSKNFKLDSERLAIRFQTWAPKVSSIKLPLFKEVYYGTSFTKILD